MKKSLKKINKIISEPKSYAYIDFLPKQMMSERFFELETFYYNHYIDEYAQKVVRIMLTLIGYYPAHFFLLPSSKPKDKLFMGKYKFGKDLSKLSFSKLAKIITHVITKGHADVRIMFEDEPCFATAFDNSQLLIAFYGANEKAAALIKTLAEHEGLYFFEENNIQ